MKYLSLLVILVNMVGCATYRSNLVNYAAPEKLQEMTADRIDMEVTPVTYINVKNKIYKKQMDYRMQAHGFFDPAKAFSFSACKAVPCRDRDADFNIYLDVSKQYTSQTRLILSTFFFIITFGLSPAIESVEYKIDAVAVDKNNKVIGKKSYSETTTMYVQWFMPLIALFTDTTDEVTVMNDLYRAVAIESDSLYFKKENLK